MYKKSLVIFIFLATCNLVYAQSRSLLSRIDSLVAASDTSSRFNGVVYVEIDDKLEFISYYGLSDPKRKYSTYNSRSQFVIGSISKQFTATLILREYDKGTVQLHVPIHAYLPDLKQSWADTVTIHHLLTHTHGIIELDQPLAFRPGSQFQYSQIGYALLADIVEKVTGKSFALNSFDLFNSCKMKNTFHPALHRHQNLVKGYTRDKDGNLIISDSSFENYVAAGGFISTASDLVVWNNFLHKGKLLSDSTYKLMTGKYATRQHPIFGPTEYGYGITVGTQDGLLQLGQTGYAPGFISMNFYFPEADASIVVLSNRDWKPEDIKNTFYYHVQILELVRETIK